LRIFDPFSIIDLYSFCISSKSDLFLLFQKYLRISNQRKISINTAYKRKTDKIRPVNLNKSDSSISGERENWKTEIKRKFDIPKRSPRKYDDLLTPKFSAITRGAKFISERFADIRIGEKLSIKEKKLLTEMLYNRKAVLIWDFTHYKKVKSEMASSQKIKTVFYKI
jgi:hypothetical protein